MLGLSVFDNAVLTVLDKFSRIGFLKTRALLDLVSQMIDKMDIKTPTQKQPVRLLSGGNQQKVVLAKWFVRHCDIYIFDAEPTRGIDGRAKGRDLQAHAEPGAGVAPP